MRQIFLGKPLHWLIWIAVIAILIFLGAQELHVRQFNLFVLAVLAVGAGAVLVILLNYRPGDRVTRDPFDEA